MSLCWHNICSDFCHKLTSVSHKLLSFSCFPLLHGTCILDVVQSSCARRLLRTGTRSCKRTIWRTSLQGFLPSKRILLITATFNQPASQEIQFSPFKTEIKGEVSLMGMRPWEASALLRNTLASSDSHRLCLEEVFVLSTQRPQNTSI